MILHIGRIILVLIEVLVIFNLLIVVHEIGHFLAARWRGLYIEKFGVWFGKPLWKKKIDGVQYSLGSLPFGGFVALPQLAPMDIIEGKAEVDRAKLPRISTLDKIIVAFAGPLFSFLLAVMFAVVIWGIGRPVTESEATTTIGYVMPESPAAQAGLKAGDKIVAVDGERVTRFGGMGADSITWRIIRSEGDTIPITFERMVNGRAAIKTVEARPIIPETRPWMRKGFRQIEVLPAETPVIAKVESGSLAAKAGLQPGDVISEINGQRLYHILGVADYIRDHPNAPLVFTIERRGEKRAIPFEPGHPTIDFVVENSPAARAGLEKGDAVVAVDGQNAKSALAISDYIKRHAGRPIAMSILHGAQRRDVTLTPEIPEGEHVARIGIQWTEDFGIVLDEYGRMTVKHPQPLEQIRAGMLSIFNTIGAVASPKSDVRLQHMSGPIMMLQVYYRMLSSEAGWRMALWFSVVLNVNLALLNLLPIPVLDGGHIMLALVEAVRRRPVNMRVLEIVQTGCALVIIGFMVYIAFFDVQDLFGTRRETPKFLPKSPPAKTNQ